MYFGNGFLTGNYIKALLLHISSCRKEVESSVVLVPFARVPYIQNKSDSELSLADRRCHASAVSLVAKFSVFSDCYLPA